MALVRYVHKIKLGDRSDVFLISSYQPEKKLSITLIDIDRCEAFSGNASNIELRSLAAVLRMNFSVFVSLTTKALTQKEADDLKFLYSFEENCQDFVFKWKSIDSDETTITLGILKMVKDDYASTIKNTFTVLSDEFSNLNKKIVDNEHSLNVIEKEKKDALHLLAEATNVKEGIEKELYSKFVLVLNEKKRKIRELDENSNINSKPLKKLKLLKSKPTKSINKFHEISESSDEIDDDLDINAPGPSNLRRDSSLLFDDEPLVYISPSKIRNRNKTKPTVEEDPASDVERKSEQDSDTESDEDLLKFL